jgi:hypothetical protein
MYVIKCDFLTEKECDQVCKYAENKENQIQKMYSNQQPPFKLLTNPKNQVTTGFYNSYSFFLDNPFYINKFYSLIKNNLLDIEWPVVLQSWVNIYDKGEGISKHKHSAISIPFHKVAKKVYAANVFVGGNVDIGVNYIINGQIKHEKNKLGEIQFFDGKIEHYVDENPYAEKRYTIGITISIFDGGLDLTKIFFPFEKIDYVNNLYLKVDGIANMVILKNQDE